MASVGNKMENFFEGCGAYFLALDESPVYYEDENDLASFVTLDLFTSADLANNEAEIGRNFRADFDNPGDLNVAYASGSELLRLLLNTDVVTVDNVMYPTSFAGLYYCGDSTVVSMDIIRDAIIKKVGCIIISQEFLKDSG